MVSSIFNALVNINLIFQAYQSMFRHDHWQPTQLSDEWRQFKQKARSERSSRNNHWIIDKLYVIIGK